MVFIEFSLKMHMGWRSLRQRSYASIIIRILELNVVLAGSTTFMAPLGLGRVCLELNFIFCALFSFMSTSLHLLIHVLILLLGCCHTGGREKAPAAFCRKALTSTDKFEMWGDGCQTRSFTFIDECVEGVLR